MFNDLTVPHNELWFTYRQDRPYQDNGEDKVAIDGGYVIDSRGIWLNKNYEQYIVRLVIVDN